MANMNLSREARLFCGVMLLTVPTIMYGGATLLGILTRGGAGVTSGLVLDETQWALFRAGHAHAGVWVILSLFLQVLLDATTLSSAPRLGCEVVRDRLSAVRWQESRKQHTPIILPVRSESVFRNTQPSRTPLTVKHDGFAQSSHAPRPDDEQGLHRHPEQEWRRTTPP